MTHTKPEMFRGWKWEMNYRGYDVYYSARRDQTMAFKSGELTMTVAGNDGMIFVAVDERISED